MLMGMFDNLKCKYELPLNDKLKSLNLEWSTLTFQTKDLDNCLCDYRITEDGELFEDIKEYERTYYTPEEKKSGKLKPWDIVKECKLIKEYSEKKDFHEIGRAHV